MEPEFEDELYEQMKLLVGKHMLVTETWPDSDTGLYTGFGRINQCWYVLEYKSNVGLDWDGDSVVVLSVNPDHTMHVAATATLKPVTIEVKEKRI